MRKISKVAPERLDYPTLDVAAGGSSERAVQLPPKRDRFVRRGDALMSSGRAKTVLAVGAHPDDIEFVMSGTLFLLKDRGYEVHYLNVANGSCGSATLDARAIARIRRKEAMAAARFLGAIYHGSLCNDIEVFYEKRLLAKIGAIVRRIAPDIILTHCPTDYMEDHANTCRLTVTAAFCRGMRNFPVEPSVLPTHRPVAVYHAQPYGNREGLGRLVVPDLFVNVESVLERKTEMLAMHRSQKNWLDESQGVNSYLAAMKDLGREVGRMSRKYRIAEGWTRHNHLGFCKPGHDPLMAALKKDVQLVWPRERRESSAFQ